MISANSHLPVVDSLNLPAGSHISALLAAEAGKKWGKGNRQPQDSLVGSNILFMAPLTQAASRRTTNSNPSLEMRVTYLLRDWFWLEVAILMLQSFGRRDNFANF